jgi:hypothetical protein
VQQQASLSGVNCALLHTWRHIAMRAWCVLLQIDLDALRELSWSGIPQELRPTCWKLLLGYLPPNK